MEGNLQERIDFLLYWTIMVVGCSIEIPIALGYLVISSIFYNSCEGITIYLICLSSEILIFRTILPLFISPLVCCFPRYSRYFTYASSWILTVLSTGFHIWGLVAININLDCNSSGDTFSRFFFISACCLVSIGFFWFIFQLAFTALIVIFNSFRPKEKKLEF
eukprot:gene9902-2224_t